MTYSNKLQSTPVDHAYLSVDMVGSTRLIGDLEAESARELLENGLQLIAEAVYKNGGNIIYTAGDGAVAEFKPIAACDNPVLLAISAGLDIQHDTRNASSPYAFRTGIDAVANAGLDSDQVVWDFAASVQELTPPGKVSISESSYHSLESNIQTGAKAVQVVIDDAPASIYLIDKMPSDVTQSLQDKLSNLVQDVAVQHKEDSAGEIKLISSIFIKIDENKNKLSNEQVELYLENIKEILKDYGATLIKRTRLSLMIVVGAPVAYEDHAIRACMIAQRVLKISEKLALPNQANIGVHSGPAVVDDIGSAHFHQYDAMGSIVSFSARLEQLAAPGQALISEQTMYLAGDAIRVRKTRQQKIKGFEGNHVLYALENVVRTYVQQKLEWDFYSQQIFINHVAEVQMFTAKLDLLSSQAVIWGINAEPGVGKSRLSYEFSKIAEKKGCHLLTTSALSYQKDLSFSLLRQFFAYVFNIEIADTSVTINDRLEHALALYPALPAHGKQALNAVFGCPTEASWQRLPQREQLQTIAACMYEILAHHAQNKPIFLTLDDMHWCDSQSLYILQLLSARLTREPVFILMSFRPEFHNTWQLFQRQETVLMPLTLHDSHDFMNCLLGSNDKLDTIKEKIIQQSDGNPFYMEEITRYLVNNRILAKEDNRYRLLSDEVDYEIPDTIQGVISGSIDRLSPENKQLLQQSSILGFVFSLSDLQLLSDMSDQSLAMYLSGLQDMGLVFTKELFPHTVYSFKHAYILEVTYQMMLTKKRVKYHEKFVTALEKSPKSSHRLADLAYHSYHAKLWLKSFLYYFEIIPCQINIDFPIDRILKDTAKAEQAWKQLSPEEQDSHFDAYATIKMQQLHALMASGRPNEIIEPFQQLESLAISKNNHWVQALALTHLMIINALLNKCFPLSPQAYDDILVIGAKAMEEKDDFDKDNFVATLYFARVLSDYIYADYEALDTNRLPMLEKLTVPNTSSIWLGFPMWNVCRLLPMMGLFEQMKLNPENAYLDELVDAVTDQEPTESTAGNHWALAMAYFAWGDLDNSKKYCLLGLKESEQINMIMFNPVFYSYLAFIAMLQGEHDKAVQHAKTAYETSTMLHHMFFGMSSMGRVAQVFLQYGHLSLLNELLEECLPQVENAGQTCRCIELYQVKADYLIASQEKPDIDAIVPILKQAEFLIDHIGALYFYPFVQRSYARLYQKLNQPELASTYRQKIADFYKEHPSTFWREYFEQELQNSLQSSLD